MRPSSPSVLSARWSAARAALGGTVELVATLAPPAKAATVTFHVDQYVPRVAARGGGYARRRVAEIAVDVEPGARMAMARWTVAAAADGGALDELPRFRFTARTGDAAAASPLLEVGAVERATWAPPGGVAPSPGGVGGRTVPLAPGSPAGMLVRGRGLEGFTADFRVFRVRDATVGQLPVGPPVAEVKGVPFIGGQARAEFAPPPGSAGPYAFRAALGSAAAGLRVTPAAAMSEQKACGALYNVYIYVIGTDYTEHTDFRCMRQLLADRARYVRPWLELTFDYKPLEQKGGQCRLTTVTAGATGDPTMGTEDLVPTIEPVYSILMDCSDCRWTVKELHFLTHSNEKGVFFAPSTLADVDHMTRYFGTGTNQGRLERAFTRDSYIKLYGCLKNLDLSGKIARYCRNAGPAERQSTLMEVRTALSQSFAYNFARYSRHNVWAAPLGAGAKYKCTYSTPDQAFRHFCVDSVNDSVLRFYEGNHEQFFPPRAAEVFDSTYHMLYRYELQVLPFPQPCSKELPARPQGPAQTRPRDADGILCPGAMVKKRSRAGAGR